MAAAGTGAAAVKGSTVIQIKSLAQLQKEINEAAPDRLLVIDFYASWCMPCKQIGGEIDRLSGIAPFNDLNRIVFIKCDVEEIEEVQEQYSITSIPFIILMRDKIRVGEMSGPNKEKLKNLITGKLEEPRHPTTR